MRHLRKKSRFTVRYTDDQARLIRRAAQLKARHRGELVTEADVIRDGSLREAESIITELAPPQPPASQAA